MYCKLIVSVLTETDVHNIVQVGERGGWGVEGGWGVWRRVGCVEEGVLKVCGGGWGVEGGCVEGGWGVWRRVC